MAIHPRQSKMDALLAAIEIGDEKLIVSRCKSLQLADFPLILNQVCLKPGPGFKTIVKEQVENVTIENGDEVVNNSAATAVENVDDPGAIEAAILTKTVKAEAAKAEKLVEAQKKAETKAVEAAQIEAKRKKKLHCKVFVKFGSSEKNDRGCKHGKNCHYKHPKLCRLALRGRCVVKKCRDHHLTATKPPAKSNTTTTSSSNNNNHKLRPSHNQGHHQASWGPFLGKTSLSPPGISSMEELAKIVTQMVIQSLGSMNSNNNNMQQSQPQTWGSRCQH
jgi:hypothetical protein